MKFPPTMTPRLRAAATLQSVQDQVAATAQSAGDLLSTLAELRNLLGIKPETTPAPGE